MDSLVCPGPPGRPHPWWVVWRLELSLFLMLFSSGAYFVHVFDDTTVRSRISLTAAVVNHGSLAIDAYPGYHPDIAVHDGHVYTNKGIGAPLVALPVYWALRRFTPLKDWPELNPLEIYLVRVCTTTLPFAILGVVLFRLGRLWSGSERAGLCLAWAHCLGTLAWLHATQFSGHEITATFAFFSFACCHLLRRRQERAALDDWRWPALAALAGLLAGIAALTEYLAAVIALSLAAYLLSLRLPWRFPAAFAAGGALCVALLAAYNWQCFGSPLATSYSHLSDPEWKRLTATGFLGIHAPNPAAAAALLFSPARGLLCICPVLYLALAGFVEMWKRRDLRREWVLLAVIPLITWLLNAGYFGWHGGWNYGPRYLVATLPFLAAPMVFAGIGRTAFWSLLVISAAQVGLAVTVGPVTPEYIANPILELFFPLYRYGCVAFTPGRLVGLQGVSTLLPLAALVVGSGLLAWRGASPLQRSTPRLRRLAGGVMTVALLATIGALTTVRTIDPVRLHHGRVEVLRRAHAATNSPALAAALKRETQLEMLAETARSHARHSR